MASFAGFGDWLGHHSWGVGLAAAAVAVWVIVFDIRSHWKEQKKAKGWHRIWAVTKLVSFLAVPTLALLAWYASDRSSDATEAARRTEKVAASNEIAQLKKASEDAERRIYSNMTSEILSVGDTNHFVWRKTAAGSWRVCMILKAAPIPGSLIGSIESTSAMSIRSLAGPNTTVRNVFLKEFWGDWWDFQNMTFHIQYSADKRETNLVKRIELPAEEIILADGRPL